MGISVSAAALPRPPPSLVAACEEQLLLVALRWRGWHPLLRAQLLVASLGEPSLKSYAGSSPWVAK